MAAVFAFLGMLLISMVVALLAALQLGDFFGSSDEFPYVIALVAGFPIVSLLILAIAYAAVPHARILAGIALLLGVVALNPLLPTGLVPWIASHSTNPYTVGVENTWITIELIVPSLIAVLVQWGLTRRRFLRARGEDDLTLWPWITTVVAALVILSPFGLAFVGSTLKHAAGDFMWPLISSITAGVIGSLLMMAWIECYIRDRVLRRRIRAPRIEGSSAHEASHG